MTILLGIHGCFYFENVCKNRYANRAVGTVDDREKVCKRPNVSDERNVMPTRDRENIFSPTSFRERSSRVRRRRHAYARSKSK